MKSPLEQNANQAKIPGYLNVSPERLRGLSSTELSDDMEKALEYMTAETYNEEIISAYLDELDRRSPMPEHPSAQDSYSSFQQKIHSMFAASAVSSTSVQQRSIHIRQAVCVGLTAAVLSACLFGSMVIAQAIGIDVFGAIAHWTSKQFSFGTTFNDGVRTYRTDDDNKDPVEQENQNTLSSDLPKEYKAIQAELNERGLSLFIPNIPTEFEVVESDIYVNSVTGSVNCSVTYMLGTDYIGFDLTQIDENSSDTVYEKDDNPVELYEKDGITYHLFTNNGNSVVVWRTENIEYSLSTNSSSINIIDLI